MVNWLSPDADGTIGFAHFHLAPKKLDQNWIKKAKSVVTPRGFEPLLPP